ncbi:MAG: VOC family protein [Burkholderiales bacterium]
MPQLNAYLSFDGTCAEAMRFYAQVLGARLDALITYGQAPADQPCLTEHSDRIMHAYLVHKDFALMAGDAPPGMPFDSMRGVMLALTFDGVAEAERVFTAFADGGSVQMPLAPTFWAEIFGMVTDRYGTAWGVNGGPKPM